jgi:hypothetical protein
MATQADRNRITSLSDFSDSNGKKYDITNHSYPEDIEGSAQYGSHKVVFFINVPVGSRQARGAAGAFGVGSSLFDVPLEDQRKLSGLSTITAGLGLGRIAGSIGGSVTADSNTTTGILDVDKSIGTDSMKRLTTAICLHMPNSLRTSWGVQYGETTAEDFAMNAAEGVAGVGALIGGATMAGSSRFSNAVAGVAGIAAGVTAGLSIAKKISNNLYAQIATKTTASNAKSEQLFKQVTFREFEFSYSFFPKSATEAENVLKIIRSFRHHMLPEFKNNTEFMFIYPSQFNIKYYFGSIENQNIEKQMTAVLTQMSVDYTPNGQFTTFANGAPTQINMALNFREIGITTKETSPADSVGI